MIKFRRQAMILFLLLLVTAVYLNGTRIFAPPQTLSTELSNLNYFGPANSWNGLLFGARKWGSMDAYIGLRNDYEYKHNHGLLDHNQESAYMGRFSSLATSAFGDWQAYQVRTHTRNLTGVLSDELGLDSLKRDRSPLLLLGVVAAAYTGRTLRYRISPNLIFESRTQMAGGSFQGQYVGWRSPAFAASAGATYGGGGQPGITVDKQITNNVSVNYTMKEDHSVGVNYSKGF